MVVNGGQWDLLRDWCRVGTPAWVDCCGWCREGGHDDLCTSYPNDEQYTVLHSDSPLELLH